MQSIECSIERMSTASRRKRQFPQTVGGPRRDQTVASFSELSLIHARSHSSEIIQKCLNRTMMHVNALTCWSCEAAVTNAFGERGTSKSQNTYSLVEIISQKYGFWCSLSWPSFHTRSCHPFCWRFPCAKSRWESVGWASLGVPGRVRLYRKI